MTRRGIVALVELTTLSRRDRRLTAIEGPCANVAGRGVDHAAFVRAIWRPDVGVLDTLGRVFGRSYG